MSSNSKGAKHTPAKKSAPSPAPAPKVSTPVASAGKVQSSASAPEHEVGIENFDWIMDHPMEISYYEYVF